MTSLPGLDPELSDLGLAIGLLTPSSDAGVELDSDWFSDPAARLKSVLADDARRAALVRFADAVLAGDTGTERNGVELVRLLSLRELGGEAVPDLTVQASLDARPADYVEIGLAATLRTVSPIVTTTGVVIPLYRAAKTGKTVPQAFALLDGGVVTVSTDLTLAAAPPGPGEFGLAGVAASVETAVAGGPPGFTLVLRGLQLPGAATAADVQIGGPAVSIKDSLLALVLGLARQSAAELEGPAAAQAAAALDLLGLGTAAGIPALPVDDVIAHGVSALRAWFVSLMGSQIARTAWLGSLGQLLNGTPAGDSLAIPIGSGPVTATLTLATATGVSGHLLITPQLGLTLSAAAEGPITLGAEATASLFTIDVAAGTITPVPEARLAVTATGSGTGDAAKLLHSSAADIGALRLGLALVAGSPRALIELTDVTINGSTHKLLDLSTPEAAAAAAGQVASQVIATALGTLGAAGAELAGLLGLDPPAGVTAIDGTKLLTDPLGTLAAWWHDLVTAHPDQVPAVLTHLRNLITGPLQLAAADTVTGTGTPDDPWSIPVLTRLRVDCWLDGSRLLVAATLSLRAATTLAGGCTTVLTQLRAQIVDVDLAAGRAHFPLAADLTARLRATGATEARLALGPASVVADFIGVHAGWSPAGGFALDFLAPGLAIDTGDERIPLVLPTVDASGHVNVPDAAWQSVEALIGVLAASSARGWLSDLVDLAGWDSRSPDPPRLPLGALAADPAAALKAWAISLVTDPDLLASLTWTLAHFFGGSRAGLAGTFAGSGTPEDPWLATMGGSAALPQLAVWLEPYGPVAAAAQASDVIRQWRPGEPALTAEALAAALADEALAGADVALLAAGREQAAAGLQALAGRWAGTDGLAAPPPSPVDGLTTVVYEDLTAAQLARQPLAPLLPAGLPAGAVIVRVAVAAPADLPWTMPDSRLLDLSTPGIAPSSFTVTSPATGEWGVALASRADATLGGATDPTGLAGQAARLQQVLSALAPAGPIVLVALGGAGHAARLAADAVPGVTQLVTLGTPWSPVTFDTMRTGVSADVLRLLSALTPALDPGDPDDPDLARARELIGGAMDAVRGRAYLADLAADRPAVGVRAGLSAVAAFGVLTDDAVGRAITAVFAAGLSARARARQPAAESPPATAYAGIRVPFAFLTPPGGHGTTVTGAAMLTLGSITSSGAALTAAPAIHVELDIADTDGWLIGGPGAPPVGGALPLELRRARLSADIGLHGTPSRARIVLGEGTALGASWPQLVVEPPADATGRLEALPMLPEAQALLTALTAKLSTTDPASPAGLVTALLRAAGLADAAGALLPDALDHLLHDPGGQVRSLPPAPLLAALAGLIPGLTVTGGSAALQLGPVALAADLAAGTISCTASGTGLISWSGGVSFDSSGRPAVTAGLGDPATDAFAITAGTGPVTVRLVRPGAPPVPLWPSPDLDGLGRFAAAAVPAEALRVVLEGLRTVDTGIATALTDLASALGMLAPGDGSGNRAIAAPLRLFDDPGGWFAQAGVLAAAAGGPFDPERVIDLLEALKPFVGLDGTPRGSWPIADGLQVTAGASASGPVVSLAVDATSWLAGDAGRAPFAAGLTASLVLAASGTPHPSVEMFLGVPDGDSGTSTPDHRRAVHLAADGSGLRVFLRPATGADIEVFPHLAGLASLLGGAEAVLTLALNELAKLSGDPVRTQIADLVTTAGRGLAIASADSPAVFDPGAIRTLAADPTGYLRAHLDDLLTQVTPGLDALLSQVVSLPAGQHAVALSGTGVLTVTVRTVVAEIHTAPFAVLVSADVTGLPVIGAVSLSLGAGQAGLTAWSASAGPAAINIGGPVVRPFARAGYAAPAGWHAETGMGLDALGTGTDGHRELTARWQQGAGLGVLVTTRIGGIVTEDGTPVGVADAAIDAVLDLVGGWVLGTDAVKALLARPVGASTTRQVLTGPVLDPAAPADAPRLAAGLLDGWPGRLLQLAGQLAGAAPAVTVGPFRIGIAVDGAGIATISLTTTDAAGIDLAGADSDLTLHLEADASWIDPPEPPGITVSLLHIAGDQVTAAPGISVNGIGIRLGKANDPLIDSGLRLDSAALHLYGSILLGPDARPALAGGFEFELGGLAVPLGGGGGDNAVAQGIMRDAGGSGSSPRPAFSPAIAVQDHGSGTSVTLRAGSGDGPWYLPIQRAFGPVYLEQAGLGADYRQGITPRQLEMISLYLDGQVSLLGLTAAVDKLRFSYHASRPFFDPASWQVDVEGFAIASTTGGLTLAGGLRKYPLDPPLAGVEYLGMLKIGYGSYGVDLFGGYAHPTAAGSTGFASFFAFGVLHAPIGGPPAFFITGIAIGLGINRDLVTPDIDHITTHPFMQALRALGPAPEPMQQLQQMRAIVPAVRGQYWVAAGLSFTSFVLVTGEVLVTVQFGAGLEVAILGLARAQLPDPQLPLVNIELALLARFSSTEGSLLVQAQLTENSYLLDPSVRLTGGFAFQTWWKGPNSGQLVVTVGGYHPRFHHDGYPLVPRLGLNWSPVDNISITGDGYFAICSEALMSGVSLEVTAHLGPAHAKLSFGADAIIFFDPFWFTATAYAEAEVGITIWLLFGSVDLDVHLGFDVTVEGPPVHVEGHFSVAGVGIPFEFGDRADPADRALDGPAFAAKYLRGDANAQVIQASVIRGSLTAGKSGQPGSGGVDKPPDGSAEHPFRVVPEFRLTFVSVVPVEGLTLTGGGATATAIATAPGLGVAPMYSATISTALSVGLESLDGQDFDLTGVTLAARPGAAFPKGVWGPAQNPQAKTIPAGDVIPASDGLTIDTVIPDSHFTGAPPIDYHQVELPLTGRRPLPFVTNTAQTNERVSEAIALRDAAGVFAAGTVDDPVRFERAALVLAAGGTGLTTVAALRGERAAAPSFGSLANDLGDAPPPVSPPVTPVVVDRQPPPPPRFNPVVKAVLGTPLSLALARPAGTTVTDPGAAVPAVAPTLASVRATAAGRTQAALSVIAPAGQDSHATLIPAGTAPLTRLASASAAAVANARPAPAAAGRLGLMSAGLLGQADPAGPGAAAVVNEGELAVITVAQRPAGASPDTVTVTGGAARVLSLTAGGRPAADTVTGGDGNPGQVELPLETERVIIVPAGADATAAGPVPGWYAGQALPSVGWGTALCGGALVCAQGARVTSNRDRADGGWVAANDLAAAAQVVTTFAGPVSAIAVAVDDYLGADAAGKLSMRLLDATRVTSPDGRPQPPEALVDGVRTILLYAVITTGPQPAVAVDDCGGGQLAGVLGWSAGTTALAALVATAGIEAAVQQPLPGGTGQRQVRYTMADGPAPPPAAGEAR